MKDVVKSRLLRWILIGIGFLSVVTGIAGIFLPLVPTVPCLLLACFCFSRSSVRFHDWLVNHRHLGPMVRSYTTHGIPLKAKVLAITTIWVSVACTLFLLAPPRWVALSLLATAAGVTWFLASRPTVSPGPPQG